MFDNYRPVSTIPIFSKIFEKLIYNRLYSYLVSKNILYDKQFGFRKNHSTSHAINYSVNHVVENINAKNFILERFRNFKSFNSNFFKNAFPMARLENHYFFKMNFSDGTTSKYNLFKKCAFQ